MNTTQIEQIANAVTAANAFEYAGNFGRGTFTHAVRVRMSGDTVTLFSACNAQISEARAREILLRVSGEIVDALTAAGAASVLLVRVRGTDGKRYGIGRASTQISAGYRSTDGFTRTLRVA